MQRYPGLRRSACEILRRQPAGDRAGYVAEFLQDIQNGKSSPLKNITSDYHYHTVEADSEKTLDMIEDMLREKGFLVEG